MNLNEIRDNIGSHKAKTRIGRGIGSGKGKTGGRGVKGQKSRSGVSIKGFEGGQMPIYQRLPKRGFTNIFRKNWVVVNLGRIQKAADDGRLDIAKPITRKDLQIVGLASSRPGNLRLLGKGVFTGKLEITVTAASKSAVAIVEKAGGSVTFLEQTPPVKLEKSEKIKPAGNKIRKDVKVTITAKRSPIKIKKPTPTQDVVVEEVVTAKTTATKESTPTEVATTKKPATKKPATAKVATAKKPATKKPTTAKVATTKKPTTAKVATTKKPATKPATAKVTTTKKPATKPATAKKVTATKKPTDKKID